MGVDAQKMENAKSKFKIIIFMLLPFAICYVLCAISGCAKKEAEEPELSEKEEALEQKISTFNLAGYGEGAKKKWEIEGKAADVFENTVKLDSIVAKAYGKGREVTVTADRGTVDKSTNNIHLEQNVVATTKDGVTLKTDYMDWQAKKETLTTDAKVVVQKENVTTRGKGAFAQPELKKVKLREEVVVEVAPDGKDTTTPTVITCSGPLEVDYANNMAVFNDNVSVKDERGEVAADRMIVYFDQKAQKISQVVAKGNVKITRGQNVSTSNEAVYKTGENKVTLSGNPKIIVYPEKK
ncbi:MAG: LPS export ABC transporter periplasmic protein LptC [Candidatus Omnitrophota bacterium]